MTDTSKSDDKSIIQRAKDCLEDYQERESDNIRRAEEAIRFRAGEQWPQAIKNDRENPNQDGGSRPCPVLDKTDQYVRQVVNEERQNRAAIKIRPVDDVADPEVAEVFTGIIRHIEDASNAIAAYTTAGEHAIDGGFGYFRILTEYEDDNSFDQEIKIKRIPNRFSVATGRHSEPDGSDMQEALIWEDMDKVEFKAQYPKAKETPFVAGESWVDDDTIRVAEFMCIKSEAKTIHMMDSGEVLSDEDLKMMEEAIKLNPELGVTAPKSIKSRETQVKSVKWYKLTAEEILETQDMVGTYIPVIKVIGNELTMPDGKTRLSGMIEKTMDPQRLHNYAHAGFIENVALAPRAPWVAAKDAIAGYEDDYAAANRANIAVLTFNHQDEQGSPIPAPNRLPPPGISPGWQQIMMNTEHGVEASAGMYGPTVGAKSQEKSGIALKEQKSQGMVGNYHFNDNLARAIQHAGRILVQWVPKYYDARKVARMLGEDGTQEMADLNSEQESATMPKLDNMGQEVGTIYNLNVGKYDVTVSTGPSYTAKRQEAADNQIQLIQAKPELMNIIGDIAFSNMDAPGSDKIAERLKALLPPQIQQMEDKKDKKPIDPRMQAMMQQMDQAGQMLQQKQQELGQVEQQLKEEAAKATADRAAINSTKSEVSSMLKVLSSERQRLRAELQLIGKNIVAEVENVLQGQIPPEVEQEVLAIVNLAQNEIGNFEQGITL